MITRESVSFNRRLMEAFEKGKPAKIGEVRQWKKGRVKKIAPGRWILVDETAAGEAVVAGEVFVAGLRDYSVERVAEARNLLKTDERIGRLQKSIGDTGESFWKEGRMPTKVQEKQEAFGAWYEEHEGKKIPRMEPSFAVVVEGGEQDILRDAAGLGKDFEQKAVLVAIYDAAGEGAVFHLDVDPDKMNDRVRGAIVQHFLEAGLGGATSLLDRPSFRLAATSPADADIIREAAKRLPAEFKAKLTAIPARVRFIGENEYDSILAGKAAALEEGVVAEVILGGIRLRKSAQGGKVSTK